MNPTGHGLELREDMRHVSDQAHSRNIQSHSTHIHIITFRISPLAPVFAEKQRTILPVKMSTASPPTEDVDDKDEALARGQYEILLPDAFLVHIFALLAPSELVKAALACKRWQRSANDDSLYHAICKRTVAAFHPDPKKSLCGWGKPPLEYLVASGQLTAEEAEAKRRALEAQAISTGSSWPLASSPGSSAGDHAPTIDDRIRELAAAQAGVDPEMDELTRQFNDMQRLQAQRAQRAADEARTAQAVETRAAFLKEFKKTVASLGSYRLALHHIPALRLKGVYAIKHTYIRKGTRDMFHAYDGILQCTYHRTFLFRPDGTLLYALLPGEVSEATKEFRRMLGVTAVGGAAAAGASGAGSGTASSSTSSAPAASVPTSAAASFSSSGGGAAVGHSYTAHGVNSLRLGSSRSSHVGVGYWWLEGRTLRAEVSMAGSIITRWVCEVLPPPPPSPSVTSPASAAGGSVTSLGSTAAHLMQPPRGPNCMLLVRSMLLLERGGDERDASPMAGLEGEEMHWQHVPALVPLE